MNAMFSSSTVSSRDHVMSIPPTRWDDVTSKVGNLNHELRIQYTLTIDGQLKRKKHFQGMNCLFHPNRCAAHVPGYQQ